MFYLDSSPLDLKGLPSKGVLHPDYCIVGIAPSPNRPEDTKLEPFGKSTWKLFSRVTNVTDKTWYMTYLVKTPKPREEKVYAKELRYWLPELYRELTLIRPDRILAMGVEPAKALCPGFQTMTEDHGVLFYNDLLQCYVVPTFNLSTSMHLPDYASFIKRDLERFFTVTVQPQIEPTIIHSVEELPSFKNKEVVLDIETTGLTLNDTITKVGLKIRGEDQAWIMHNPEPEDLFVAGLKLSSEPAAIIGHNLAYEMFMLTGKDTQSLANSPWLNMPLRDTMLLVHNSGKHHSLRLKHLVTMETNQPGPHSYGSFDSDQYLVADLTGTEEIYTKYVSEYKKPSGQLMCDLAGILGAMRARGVYIDLKRLAEVQKDIHAQWHGYATQLNDIANINWSSSAQVSKVLIEQGVPLTEKTKGGQFSVAEGALEPFAEDHEVVSTLLDYKTLDKLIKGFIAPYLEMGTSYIYPSLLLNGTSTGRLSCKDPNLQQVPRQGAFKTIFKSRWHQEGGEYALIDLSQAELRAVALLSGDVTLAKALTEEDAHRYIASMAFNKPQDQITAAERKASKSITFGLLYGGSAGGLAKRANLPKDRVEQVLDTFFSQFPKLNMWLNNYRQASSYSNTVSTLFGRTRDLSLIRHYEGNNGVYRKSVNTPVQSVANDIMLWVIRHTWRNLRLQSLNSRPIFAVHDSMLLEVYPGEKERVTHIVQEAFRSLRNSPLKNLTLFSSLPIVGDITYGPTWASIESTCSDFYDKSLPSYHCSSLE